VVATSMVADACARHVVKLAYASSSEVYGDNGWRVLDESSSLAPTSGIYGLGKQWGEQVCASYLSARELLILRPLMVYGPGQRAGPGWAALPTFVENAIKREPIVVHRGSRRSWCYVTDVARAIVDLLEADAAGAYNVGRDDDEVEMVEVARMACRLTGVSEELIEVVDPPRLQTVIKRVSCAKLGATGWRPMVSLEDGMKRVYEDLLLLPSRSSI
jgi:GDP-L-fucose synthase